MNKEKLLGIDNFNSVYNSICNFLCVNKMFNSGVTIVCDDVIVDNIPTKTCHIPHHMIINIGDNTKTISVGDNISNIEEEILKLLPINGRVLSERNIDSIYYSICGYLTKNMIRDSRVSLYYNDNNYDNRIAYDTIDTLNQYGIIIKIKNAVRIFRIGDYIDIEKEIRNLVSLDY